MKQIRIVLAALVVLAAGLVEAKTCTWTAGSDRWTNPAAWEGGTMPDDGDEVIVSGAGGIINLEGGTTVALRSLLFVNESASGWQMTNGTVFVRQEGLTLSIPKSLYL
ncbi:MAG: hypothetical protein ACI4RA_11365, partial [Kiritimatiellia bacterium]